MANFPGNALRLYAMSTGGPATISTTGKQYFGADFQADFPANFFANPRVIHVFARGIYTLPLANTANVNIGLDVVSSAGTALLSEMGGGVPTITGTNRHWMKDVMANSQNGSKIGVPCSTIPNGFSGLATLTALGVANFSGEGVTSALSVDTTLALSLRIWAQWTGTLLGTTALTLQMFNVFVTD